MGSALTGLPEVAVLWPHVALHGLADDEVAEGLELLVIVAHITELRPDLLARAEDVLNFLLQCWQA